jgi:hypothetical protein
MRTNHFSMFAVTKMKLSFLKLASSMRVCIHRGTKQIGGTCERREAV